MGKKTEHKVKLSFNRSDIGSYEKGGKANLTKEETRKVSMFLEDYKEELESVTEATPKKAASTKKSGKGIEEDG